MDAPTDQKLLRDYLHGDAGAFELLVRRYAQEVYQFALRLMRDSVAAEDAVQETFLQLHLSASAFDPARRFKPWLFTIAANKCRDHLRKRDRKREVSFEANLLPEEAGGPRFLDLLSSEHVPPEEDFELDERRRLVREIVDDLPPRLAEVLILAYYHRFPYKDIAQLVGVPLGTVKSRLHAAVTQFGLKYRAARKERSQKEL